MAVFFIGGHRHATKVRGLEAYGIEPAGFGRRVQKRFACSTAAQPAPVSASKYGKRHVFLALDMCTASFSLISKYFGGRLIVELRFLGRNVGLLLVTEHGVQGVMAGLSCEYIVSEQICCMDFTTP